MHVSNNIPVDIDKNACEIAIGKGDKWANKNNGALAEFLIPYHISRWKEWLENPDYNHAKHKIDILYETNPKFKEAFHKMAETFYERSKKHESQLIEKNIFYLFALIT